MRLRIRGQVSAGQITLDTAISDLELIDGPGGPLLVSVSGPEGGLATFSPGQTGLPQLVDQEFFVGNQVSGTGHELIVSSDSMTTEIMVTGLETNGIASYTLGSGGSLGPLTEISGADFGTAPAVAALAPGGQIVLADPAQPGFTVATIGQDGGLVAVARVADTETTHAASVVAMEAVRVDDTDILIVASQSEYGLTAYRLGSGAPVAGDSVGPAQGLGIMVPSDIAVAATAQGSFVIVASAPMRGAAGALSVMRLDAMAGLTPTDHVLDTRESRFGHATRVETVTHDGHAYVVAAGGDAGVSLLELTPDGRLVHLDSLAGTVAAGLDDVTALEIGVVGGMLQVFVATEGDAGLVMLSIDLAGQGVTRVAAAGGTALTGTGLDDILVDGSGADTLAGGAGTDRFVFTADGIADTVIGFDPAEDVLDLSGLPFCYDAAALAIAATATGATIAHRGETIVLLSTTGGPLDPEAVRAAVEIAVNHGYIAPSEPPGGASEGADSLTGGDGADTLLGLGGDDTLIGGAGEDLLEGGDGDDSLIGGDGNDTLDGGGGGDTIRGGDGYDLIFGGAGNNIILGEAGNDSIVLGAAGNDSIAGEDGNDAVSGGIGNDTILGAAGNDTLLGDAGDDLLDGGSATNWLLGGAGDDRLFGGADSDLLAGEDGNDLLDGGSGNDLLIGGAGNDTMTGGEGADLFVFVRGHGADVITQFDFAVEKLVLDKGWVSPGMTFAKFVGQYVSVDASGILFDFGAGDSFLIESYANTDAIGDFLGFV